MDGRIGSLLLLGDVLTTFAALLAGDPTPRAWAWAFNLDAPLAPGIWLPVLWIARSRLLPLILGSSLLPRV